MSYYNIISKHQIFYKGANMQAIFDFLDRNFFLILPACTALSAFVFLGLYILYNNSLMAKRRAKKKKALRRLHGWKKKRKKNQKQEEKQRKIENHQKLLEIRRAKQNRY